MVSDSSVFVVMLAMGLRASDMGGILYHRPIRPQLIYSSPKVSLLLSRSRILMEEQHRHWGESATSLDLAPSMP